MAHARENLKVVQDIRVFLRNAYGNYLAQDENGLYFTDELSKAVVLNYHADHVAAQLDTIQKDQGINLVPEPVPLDQIYEQCDRCKELFMPVMTYFDGHHFLCSDCRSLRLQPLDAPSKVTLSQDDLGRPTPTYDRPRST